MNKEVAERWIEAMESGRYRKGRGILHSTIKPERHCALGVLVAEECLTPFVPFSMLADKPHADIARINDTTPGFGAVCEYVREHLIEEGTT